MSVKQNLFVSVFVHKCLMMLNDVEYTTSKMFVTQMSNYLFVISFPLMLYKTLRYPLARALGTYFYFFYWEMDYHFWDLQTIFFLEKCISNNFFVAFCNENNFYVHFEERIGFFFKKKEHTSCVFIHVERSHLNENKFALYKLYEARYKVSSMMEGIHYGGGISLAGWRIFSTDVSHHQYD